MNKYKETFGVGINKDVFDVHGSETGHHRYNNDESGFIAFAKAITVNASQLCSHVGITPTIRESGSSVRGPARISKEGNIKLRNLLFLCSFNACKHNKACRDLYQRIVNKGKSKKLALIAVANKLLKQCFAIAKSGRPYDETQVSVLPR
ncbi:IS110 family transposase [Nonlabens mediterrranea]|uniref:IS110 family transposase n=1 Tax=Nonlabens mediterrranea TaxID=1419947 RepID=A0ABS0A5A0_9FLAO|nr:IS110 family transposase [Nonlabens mediterrranea]